MGCSTLLGILEIYVFGSLANNSNLIESVPFLEASTAHRKGWDRSLSAGAQGFVFILVFLDVPEAVARWGQNHNYTVIIQFRQLITLMSSQLGCPCGRPTCDSHSASLTGESLELYALHSSVFTRFEGMFPCFHWLSGQEMPIEFTLCEVYQKRHCRRTFSSGMYM